MENEYVVEFVGELKDDRFMQKQYYKQYNLWCDVINEQIPRLNEEFDKNWTGEPIQDYLNNTEYREWMLAGYRRILRESGLNKSMWMRYIIGNELELIGVRQFGRKRKFISFVLKKRA